MFQFKNYLVPILVLAVLFGIGYIYELGYESGRDNVKADYLERLKEANSVRDKNLNTRINTINQNYQDDLKLYRLRYEQKLKDAKKLAYDNSKVDEQAEVILNEIDTTKVTCNSTSNELDINSFRLYQQTRSIVSRPVDGN